MACESATTLTYCRGPRQIAAALEHSPVKVGEVGQRPSETTRFTFGLARLDHAEMRSRAEAEAGHPVGGDAPILGYDKLLVGRRIRRAHVFHSTARGPPDTAR